MLEAVTIHDVERQITDGVAARAAASHGFTSAASIRLLAESENTSYLVTEPGTRRERSAVIRVHRGGYHDPAEIESELVWLDVLARLGTLRVVRPLETAWGERVLTFPVEGGVRHAVAFERVNGTHPDPDALTAEEFHRLGAITATLHDSVRHLRRPVSRSSWDWPHTLGASGRWGRWEDGPGMTPELVREIAPAVRLLLNRLAVYGEAAHRYGLIHGDLRTANLMVDEGGYTVIDFDDCGFGWFMYDFATAVSFRETDPRLAEWQAAWVDGYRTVRQLMRPDERMLPSFVLLRRLMLLARMGSHPSAADAVDPGGSYAEGTAVLARTYLTSAGQLTAAA
ncbi:Ser/Thr protein kinase RdoA involved in Cpx stress response, MazF antagonist [Raineyella antarctica]|uniref:Ser/Thr protein kinase RdoA involved in Cpx stress response, MazF antagonist n=1 Tax=Raineyella antarctica TaxID=1577474 RepID=A0A1G6I6F2_9ACTN|nr:phosphotransferase [Raineyella antarctica]SDC01615.1 Ser/Thr protein kinase RdoA involved in Cpx stress response, MazF antagonist [Raineyella antarctica]